ncbi:39642_t:CDS:2 [Gigaspora margarita]|uniref:39642_t:CDS:1 n=1 Tax=Gigaspora margarita TaxID=4874 RepID=A0ABN7W981_GIGMA|nr:39642_t:CDS:2 [Gigaspora margarita]
MYIEYLSSLADFTICSTKPNLLRKHSLTYLGYKPDEYVSEFNLKEETVPTSSNYYSESLIILPKYQKANVQDKSVGQLSDISKSSKVSKFGGSLLCSPTWKWFEEIYIDKVRHGRCNVEMADKKPCNTKIKTGNSTIAL